MRFRAERVRTVFLLLAPVALFGAAWLLPAVDPNGRMGLTEDREGYIELARRQALSTGQQVEGWPAGLDVSVEDSLARYLRYHEGRAPAAVEQVRRLAPPVDLEVTFVSDGREPDVEILLAVDGSFLGGELRLPPPEGRLSAEEIGEAFLADWLGEGLAARAERRGAEDPDAAPEREEDEEDEGDPGEEDPEDADPGDEDPGNEDPGNADPGEAEPEEENADETDAGDTDAGEEEAGDGDLQWRLSLEDLPGLTLEPQVKVEDGRVVAWRMETSLEPDPAGPRFERGGGSVALRVTAGSLLALVGVVMLGWGLWRYWLRLQEAEVSHARTLLLAFLVAAMAAMSLVYLLLGGLSAQLNDDFIRSGAGIAVAGLVVGLMALPLGLAFGLVWSGCEGDVRQIFPAKLVSLDALLSGRWLTRDPARALVRGAACACWVVLGHVLVVAVTTVAPQAGPDLMAFRFTVSHPWQYALALSLAVLVPYSSLGFLAPLSLLRRWTRSRWRTVPPLAAVLWLACLLLPWITLQMPMTVSLLLAGVWTAAFLVPFFTFDLLTAGISFVLSTVFFQGLLFLAQPSAALRSSAAQPALLLGVLLFVAGLVLRYGRDLEAREVRPGYARNMLERAALSAELSAALQARGKLLPAAPPEIEGMELSLHGSREEEVEGEYYDFFPRPDGATALALANFGHQGLAAALRLTLAKGHLMAYSRRLLAPAETVRRLERRLEELVTDPEEIGLAYAVVHPKDGRVEVAGLAGGPWALVWRGEGEVESLLGGSLLEEAPESAPRDPGEREETGEGTVSSAATTLAPGDAFALLSFADQVAPGARRRFLRSLGKKDLKSAAALSGAVRKKGLPSATILLVQVVGKDS